MKKIITCICLFAFLFNAMVTSAQGIKVEFDKENIKEINISSLPKDFSRRRNYTDLNKISDVVDYLSSLNLEDDFSEEHNNYYGETIEIIINYHGGNKETYYNFGNLFFGVETGNSILWHKMNYDEAKKIDDIIENNESDLYNKGHVRGDDTATISDALEILMYLADMPASIINGNEQAKSAAIITDPNGEELTISDALDILMYLAGMKQSKLYALYGGK